MLKQKIKQFLTKRADAEYEREVELSRAVYSNWYREYKNKLSKEIAATDHSAGDKFTTAVVRYSHLKNYILSGGDKPDIIIACDDEGNLTDFADQMIRDYFAANPRISLVYGDEDRIDENGELTDPWLKSDWAPDTFLSTFYFGSIFAFRSSELLLVNPGGRVASDYKSRQGIQADSEEETVAKTSDVDTNLASFIYGKFCLKLAQAEGGFSRRSASMVKEGKFPIGHISEILFHRTTRPVLWDSRLIHNSLTGRFSPESAATRLISIIILSKDNPEILKTCISTIEKYTVSSPYEIIVVDNGSSEANRAKYQDILEAHDRSEYGSGTQYIYEPMDFNFSKMCNMGAEKAGGELLLFLNDDIEIRKPGWLSYLSEKAKLPYVGAVGMKLLYPGSDVIQHAGVVNLRVGPVHKLQYQNNTEEHYFGFNKGVRNVLAVTGACLMVRTELFREIGGFDEEKFAVAFNDVDLCYRIFERGYYNVVRNNMYLYHHESLSRGDDRVDKVKSARLSKELKTLLLSHPDLYGVDPFYHKYLSQNPAETRFVIDIEEEMIRNLRSDMQTPVRRSRPLPEKWTDPVLRLGVEYANSLDEWYLGPFAKSDDRGYYVKGYSFVINADNAVYERKLLLRKTVPLTGAVSDEIWEVPVHAGYREDIANNLTNQKNDLLTGFFTVFPENALPAGIYQIGMLEMDRTSTQRLVNWSDVSLRVKSRDTGNEK